MTVLQLIANAMSAALTTGRPAGVPEPKLWSGVALDVEQLPARTLAWTEETTERTSPTSALARRDVTFAVQDVVAGTGAGGSSAQELCEAFRAWSIGALVGSRYLDGAGVPLAIDTVELGTLWEFEQGEVPVCRCTHSFKVTFSTRANDAEQRV